MRTHSISGSFAGAPWSLSSLVGSCLPSGYSRALLACSEICRATVRGKEDTSPGAAVKRTVFKTCSVKKWSQSTKHRAARGKQVSGVQKQGGDMCPREPVARRSGAATLGQHRKPETPAAYSWNTEQYRHSFLVTGATGSTSSDKHTHLMAVMEAYR